MARMYPDSHPNGLPRAVVRVWQQLKRIRSDDLVCRLSYALDGTARPEFFLIYRERFVFLLAVCGADTEEIDALFQADLFDAANISRRLDLQERHTMETFVDSVAESMGSGETDIAAVQKWILFPRASQRSVRRLGEAVDWPDYFLLGQEACAADRLFAHIEGAARNPLGDVFLQSLKGQFSPETVIPAEWIARRAEPRDLSARQTDFFLDEAQEAALKSDLDLSPEARGAAEAGSLRLLTGVAGCGKTLVLLQRARMAAKMNPGARILVLMHNKALRADLAARAREIDPQAEIEWSTFYAWIRRFMPYTVLPSWERDALLADLRNQEEAFALLPLEFLKEEFEWISENALLPPRREWYLDVERTGRQRALQRSQRETVFTLYHRYREALVAKGQNDWSGIPQAFLRRLDERRVHLPVYDAIFIDEAQFFAPVWFHCVRRALHPDHGNLFMAADPTQGFLRSGQSWNQVLGREVRGRSQRLERPYRNTRPIMEMAKRFYLSRLGGEEGEVNLPDDEALAALQPGESPRFRLAPSRQDEVTILANEVSAALEGGLSPGRLLVIHADPRRAQILLDRLQAQHPDQVVEAADATDRLRLRVCSVNTCTGLESPVVLLGGFDHLFESEQEPALDEADRSERVRANTKKIFVALTRASERLLICHRHTRTRALLEALTERPHG